MQVIWDGLTCNLVGNVATLTAPIEHYPAILLWRAEESLLI